MFVAITAAAIATATCNWHASSSWKRGSRRTGIGAGRVDCSLYANFVASVVAAVAAVAAVADVATATANNYSNIVAAGAAAVAGASLCVLNGNCSGG